MLKITIHDSIGELWFELEGKLSGPWVGELRQCWRTGASTTKGRRTVADLREVDFVDSDGQALLAEMHHQGVRLVSGTPLIQAVIDEACATRGCGTVEEQPARHDASISPTRSQHDQRAV